MKTIKTILSIIFLVLFVSSINVGQIKMSKETLIDKIKGAWAAQVIGVTFGGPTEFRYQGSFIPDYQPLDWNEGLMKWWY